MKRFNDTPKKIQDSKMDKVFYGVVSFLVILLIVVILYPVVYVVSSSLSSGNAVGSGKVVLWPVDFSTTGYEIVFSYKRVWISYLNTIFYTVVGTSINVLLTILTAYPLSRKNFRGRKIYTALFMFTMIFSGGIIPSYILMSKLHLTNTRAAIIFSSAISIYNMIIMRTFFQNSIPNELLEAAKIDGISDIGYLLKIVLPLSKPILAVIALYYAVGQWNSYFNAMLYLRDTNLYPLQLVLRDVLAVSSQIDLSSITDPELLAQLKNSAEVIKYALIVVASAPIMMVYPFVAKFFEKGVMIGSVKG